MKLPKKPSSREAKIFHVSLSLTPFPPSPSNMINLRKFVSKVTAYQGFKPHLSLSIDRRSTPPKCISTAEGTLLPSNHTDASLCI